jgi:hypothetical protein
MGDSDALEKPIAKYGLSGVDRTCDADRKLCQGFGLKRGRLRQLFGRRSSGALCPGVCRVAVA